jgi:hypothetical protein
VCAALAVIVFWHRRLRLWRTCGGPLGIGAVPSVRGRDAPHSDVVAGSVLGFVTVAVVAMVRSAAGVTPSTPKR